MKGIAKKILIAIVGLFFMLSASEISCKYFHNTFDDDYDFYVQPDNTHTTNIAFDFFFKIIVAVIPVTYVLHSVEVSAITFITPLCFQYFSPPLFLQNCVWLI
ncbi:MAG: hypothetical protein P4L34_07305 [Paludibacter sp.]|nr:hypothetical protein [Paludibacter sp.]